MSLFLGQPINSPFLGKDLPSTDNEQNLTEINRKVTEKLTESTRKPTDNEQKINRQLRDLAGSKVFVNSLGRSA